MLITCIRYFAHLRGCCALTTLHNNVVWLVIYGALHVSGLDSSGSATFSSDFWGGAGSVNIGGPQAPSHS